MITNEKRTTTYVEEFENFNKTVNSNIDYIEKEFFNQIKDIDWYAYIEPFILDMLYNNKLYKSIAYENYDSVQHMTKKDINSLSKKKTVQEIIKSIYLYPEEGLYEQTLSGYTELDSHIFTKYNEVFSNILKQLIISPNIDRLIKDYCRLNDFCIYLSIKCDKTNVWLPENLDDILYKIDWDKIKANI